MDKSVSDTMLAYWVNFANKGNPNGKHMLWWPPYQVKMDLAMLFGDRITTTEVPHKAALDFLDG